MAIRNGVALDNRHVVPYNPWFSHKYDCHINVEVCTSITGVKYLYKYVYKGNDRAAVSFVSRVDEIADYVRCDDFRFRLNPEEQDNLHLPSEFLKSLNSGIPLHRLRLKRYAPVLLLRNLNTDMGLCNGTRLQIVEMKANYINARILRILPRIYCDSSDKGLPSQIRRKQFPVQPCLAMTINKSQGQSLHHLGLFLPRHVVAHGQLYVALSRVKLRGHER
ncbi:ATP-dependent DNA helicase PIF1-like [Anopheles marshallii]|uniref:ATP-dependent DNA helicase PIF1-like n=1 Tax=Anopheles marshallii TaxID=1521116 RepID=UPI00237AD241|nr:ATP-dependent DNA helicase PIF1-like [Anopheles marshallii]